jgi:hypothetical protein
MSNYSTYISDIRSSREKRKEEYRELYKLKLKKFDGDKKSLQFSSGERPFDPWVKKKLDQKIYELSQIRKEYEAISLNIKSYDQLQKLLILREEYGNEIKKNDESWQNNLKNRESSDSKNRESLEIQKSSWIARRDRIEEEISAIQKRLEKHNEKDISAVAQEISERIDRTQRDIYELESRLHITEQGGNVNQLDPELKERKKKLAESETTTKNLIERFFEGRSPQQLIEEWDDQYPIMLFPVRLETRFKLDQNPAELWIRIFPDEIAVNTHEETLTFREVDSGKDYWKLLWAATDEQKKKEAWSGLANKFGGNRAGWVALNTKPLNWNDQVNSEDELQFPSIETVKTNQWTEAPHSRIMPDRFVLLAFRGNLPVDAITTIGKQIDDILIVGPAPLGEDGQTPSLKQDKDNENRIDFGQDFAWVADFNLAVSKGLGFKINLTEKDPIAITRGYDQLMVVGLKHTSDHDDGKHLVEDLINNHHYSKKGFSLIRQGTPTNNTEESDSGFSVHDPLNNGSYFVETGEPLFNALNADRSRLTDGQKLAELIGISYEPLQYIANSNAMDYTEAAAMNSALYSTTLGYFMHSMLNEVIQSKDLGELRNHFTRYVVGRGALPAIRVGNQPYGLLLTSSFGQWNQTESMLRDGKSDSFETRLYSVISFFEKHWKPLVSQLSHISKTGDPSKNLMDVLGLHPTSVEFFQLVGYSFDYLDDIAAFGWDGEYAIDRWEMVLSEMTAMHVMQQLGYKQERMNGSVKPVPMLLQLIFQHYHTSLDKLSLIDGLPFSETNKIKYFDEANQKHYIHWLIENRGNISKLERKDFNGAPAPNSLLFMMLLHSHLIESGNKIHRLLLDHNIKADELIRSRKFMNMSTSPSVSLWEVFKAPVNRIIESVDSEGSLYEHVLHSKIDFSAFTTSAKELMDFQGALDVLKDMPTAALERCMVEHLDTLTYRLDAWQNSLFTKRIEEQRNVVSSAEKRVLGVYVGAYGYLENVRPGAQRQKINETALPPELRENKNNLYEVSGNGGFVHAPSINHAAAAAILRSGYLSHADIANKEMLTVNLSSERVKRAMFLVEGLRNGQTLEALLGYMFERGLHERTTQSPNPVILNQFIPPFRKAFPIKKTKIPQQGNVTGPEEIVDDFSVTNGLMLAETTLAAPYISSSMTNEQSSAIVKERDNIKNSLDALKDLLVAESAYQLAMGNFERAAAVIKSVSDGTMVSDIEVVNTARGTNLSITNKMVIQFNQGSAALPASWGAVQVTLRSTLEPELNAWIATLIGDPTKIRCVVKAVDKEGNVLMDAGSEIQSEVSIKSLNIQAIDIMYLTKTSTDEYGISEFESRVRHVFAQDKLLGDDVIVKIEFGNRGSVIPPSDLSVKSFAEILPMLDTVRNLISGSRPIHARDYTPASKNLVAAPENPENYNITELSARIDNHFEEMKLLFLALETAYSNMKNTPDAAHVSVVRSGIIRIADAGFSDAFPMTFFGSNDREIELLSKQAESLLDRFDVLSASYNKLFTELPGSANAVKKVQTLSAMSRLFTGEDFVVLPKFNFANTSDIQNSFNDTTQLLSHSVGERGNTLVVEEWIHGLSNVRPKMHMMEVLGVYNDTFNEVDFDCRPIQLPYRNNDTWLAVEYPTGTKIDHDTLSIVLYTPQGFSAAQPQSGLIIDEWVEVVPQREEVTALTFNYNQPNSTPPQAILLALAPVLKEKWTWEELVEVIRDTFYRAKMRAVEPDQIDAELGLLNTLLPAIISEFSTGKNSISLDLALLNVMIAPIITKFYQTETSN